MGGNALPLLDPAVLERLREELDDDAGVWKLFIQNFVELLPTRIQKLRLALTTGDVRGSMDAVLSLKTSGQMVGAGRLAELAEDLERSVRTDTGHVEPDRLLPLLAAEHLPRITRCGQQTTDLLIKYLGPP